MRSSAIAISLMLAAVVSATLHRPTLPRAFSRVLAIRGGEDADDDADLKMYPPLSEEEIAEKLNTIPVFGITDDKGQSVVHKTGDGVMVNHVFLTKEIAEAMLTSFKDADPSLGSKELMVSDVPLGMIWKSLAVPNGASNATTAPVVAAEDGAPKVELRLVADPTDLQIARNMSANTEMQLAAAAEEGGEVVAASMKKKIALLNEPWGVVPLFSMAGMKIRVKASPEDAEPKELRPWFLTIQGCIDSYKKALGINEDMDAAEAEEALSSASLHMATLDELVAAMGKESPVDFRGVIFMPSEGAIAHMREKIEQLMKERAADGGAGPSKAQPASSPAEEEGGGLFDEDDDDDADSPF